MLSKFRLSSHDFEIEKRRYDKKSIKPHERYCRYCKSTNYLTVEDEFHFPMKCPLYNHERTVLLNKIYEMFPCIEKLSLRDQFVWLMSQENEICINLIASFITQSMSCRTKTLDDLLNNSYVRSTCVIKHTNNNKIT